MADDDDEDKLGLERNNPPGDAETSNDDWVDGGSASPALTTLSEADKESDALADGNEDDDASPTALGWMANGSNATNASTTALDLLVDGSDAPPTSTTTLGVLVGGSNATREGESAAAGAIGEEETPVGNGATGDSSIPPMQQSTLYPLFRQGSKRVERPLATAALVQNGMTVLTKVDNGSGTTPLVGCPLAARNAGALNGATAAMGSGWQLASVVGEMRRAPRVSSPLAAVAVSQVNAEQAGENVEGVAVHALGTSQAGVTTEGVAVRALSPLPSRTVVETVEAAADMVARPGTAVCTDGTAAPSSLSAADACRNASAAMADRVTTIACTGGCVGPCGEEHAMTFVPVRVLAASAPPAVANLSLPAGPQAAGAAVGVTAGALLGAVARAVVREGGGSGNNNAASPLVKTSRVNMTQFLPQHCTEAKLRVEDPQLQRLIDADRRLCSVYGNTIHQNDGIHLNGGIGLTKDAKWQWLYLRVASGQLLLYDLSNGRWANRFLETLASLWIGVVERCWNSERPLVFQAIILHRVRGVDRFHDVKPIIWGWLDAWDTGPHVALVKAV
jgi:hypothetical protein